MTKKIIAIDIECTGLYVKRDSKIFCVAVNYGDRIKVETDVGKLKAILEDEKITKVIHNANFDCYWLKMVSGITVKNIWDTSLMERVINGDAVPRSSKDENLKMELSASLKYTLYRYKLTNSLIDKSIGASFATRDRNAPLTKSELDYAKKDVEFLLMLQAMQERRLIKMDLMRVANLENNLVEKVVDMRCRGILLDKKAWLKISDKYELELNELQKKLPSNVSWSSPAQIKRFFFARGVVIGSLTDLSDIANNYNDPHLTILLRVRKLQKLVSTYGRNWLIDKAKDDTVDWDGRVRADFEQIINTGRFSCSHPNLQQLPKDTEHRSAFVPMKNNVFVVGDFSQQEIGIMAAASKEEVWIKAMLRKEDVHALTASLLYPEWAGVKEKGCTFPQKCNCSGHLKLRHVAKTINFAIAYGAGPQNISRQLNLTMNDAMRLLRKYKLVVPNLTKWLDRNGQSAIKTRETFSADIFKRRRTLRDPEDWMLKNIGKNNPVQSAGANMIKLSMVSTALPIVLTIHDELVVEVPKSKANAALKELKGVMEKSADFCTGVKGLITVTPKIVTSL